MDRRMTDIIEVTGELWTQEIIHEMSEYVSFSQLRYSVDDLPTQLGVGVHGAYLYLNEDELDEYVADLQRARDIIFGSKLKAVG